MGAGAPPLQVVTRHAQGSLAIRDSQEVAQLVVVGIVAGRAFQLAALAEVDAVIDQVGRADLRVAVGQRPVVAQADRVVVGQIGREVGRSRRHVHVRHRDRVGDRPVERQPQRNRPVVTAQTQLAGRPRLIRAGVHRAAAIDAIIRRWTVPVPQRGGRAGVVRRVTEDADLILRDGPHRPGAEHRQVVLRVHDAVVGRGEAAAQPQRGQRQDHCTHDAFSDRYWNTCTRRL